jgi:hypothetical protein
MNHRQSLLVAAAVAAVLGVMASFPAAGSATIVRSMPIAIRTQQRNSRSGSFTLAYRPRTSVPVSDHGSVARVVDSQTARPRCDGTCWRQVAGTELLESSQGTLTLRWSGTQQRSNGRATGTWSIITGTGIYADDAGRGRFVSVNAATEYRGWLITAM